MRENLFNH